jgi:hypothetical protein
VQGLYGSAFEDLLQWCEVSGPEHVHDEGLAGRGELEQADSAVAGGEARGLDVHADSFGGFEGLHYVGEVRGARDQLVAREALLHAEDSSRGTRINAIT